MGKRRKVKSKNIKMKKGHPYVRIALVAAKTRIKKTKDSSVQGDKGYCGSKPEA